MLDGSLHVERDCCQSWKCRKCGAIEHYQATYGGYITMCERCPTDTEFWKPSGTYCPKCECTREWCEKRNCASRM